ncbi:hypothetical protein BC628DRAFT_990930 [Trametes gibbosa]|nr:hypothetical protein BC628DRAFT_990930 [Trametes gibbosa]
MARSEGVALATFDVSVGERILNDAEEERRGERETGETEGASARSPAADLGSKCGSELIGGRGIRPLIMSHGAEAPNHNNGSAAKRSPRSWNRSPMSSAAPTSKPPVRRARSSSGALETVRLTCFFCSTAVLAIVYVIQKTPYVFAITGIDGRNVEHLHANLAALAIVLSRLIARDVRGNGATARTTRSRTRTPRRLTHGLQSRRRSDLRSISEARGARWAARPSLSVNPCQCLKGVVNFS